MFLFKIWFINIDFGTIMSFIIGIVFGVMLVGLIYAILVVASLKDKKAFVKTQDDSLKEDEVKELIYSAQNTFKDKKLRGKTGKVTYCYNLSKDLAYGIAARFYPKSKYPLLEMTVDEAVLLLEYIKQRIDELLNRRSLKILRRINISFIMDASKKTKTAVNSRAFNVGKDVAKSVGIFKKIINVINPFKLVEKAVINASLSIALNKLCLIIIAVVGEETYKIYSKKVLNKDVTIESNVDEIAKEIEEEFKDSTSELKNENVEYKFLSRYYLVNKQNKKYDSLFDKDMKLKGGI